VILLILASSENPAVLLHQSRKGSFSTALLVQRPLLPLPQWHPLPRQVVQRPLLRHLLSLKFLRLSECPGRMNAQFTLAVPLTRCQTVSFLAFYKRQFRVGVVLLSPV
jgi:hypothetical protein